MNKVRVRNHFQAEEHLNGGRSGIRRAISGSLELWKDSDYCITVRFSKKTEDWIAKFYSDGSLAINSSRWDNLHNQINELGEQYKIYAYWKNNYRMLWVPSFGTTPVKNVKCSGCSGTGHPRYLCAGPGICKEVLSIPAHLVMTGAPGAHCSHFETTYHHLGKCEHGETIKHKYHEQNHQCWQCKSTGRKDIGGKVKGLRWTGKPVRFYEDGTIQTFADDTLTALPDHLKFRQAA